MKIFDNHTLIIIFVLSAISVILIVVGFCLPPSGQIDGSVLKAVGEVFGFAVLWTVIFALRRGADVTLRHGQTEAIINSDSDEELNNNK